MKIVLSDSYKKNFQDILHVSVTNIEAIVNDHLKMNTLENEDLAIKIYLSKLINNKFYVLVLCEEKENTLLVYAAFKILKEFIEEKPLDPYIILQKFVWKFGLTIKAGEQLSKFIYKEQIELPTVRNHNHDVLQWMNPQNHSCAIHFYLKKVRDNEKDILKIFLAYAIDTNRYKSWFQGNSQQDIAQAAIILENKLQECRYGLDGWREYEDLCIEIIEYLFRNSFKEFRSKTQTKTHDNIERRDLIVVNDVKETISFWSDIKREFNSNHIIFEFKNLKDEIGKDEVYQVDDYTNKALGRFAILFSRKGLSESGRDAIRRKYREEQKVLILNCSDGDLIAMLRKRGNGEDPIKILKDKKIEFELSF